MREKAYYFLIGTLAILLSSSPYLYGWTHTPPGACLHGFDIKYR
jgi:hypothetical protein